LAGEIRDRPPPIIIPLSTHTLVQKTAEGRDDTLRFQLRQIALAAVALLSITMAAAAAARAEGKPAPIEVSAESAILMDGTSGRVLFEKDAHKKMRIASITKVMTAILAIESGKMDQTVKVDGRAVGTEGSSIYLKAGEKLKLRDLVYGLLLRSGNDAAVAIAIAVAGSESGFVRLMNEKAMELGMLDTHFANPHGLDDPDGNHYSTAYDMALLTKYARQNRTFRTIFKAKYYSAPQEGERWERKWKNKNKLLFRYKYSTGGKTGFTKRAGRTLISTASKRDLDLIAVTLNDGDDWRDHMNLFNWAFQNYKMTEIVHKGRITNVRPGVNENRLYVARDVKVPLNDEEKDHLSTAVTLFQTGKNEKRADGAPFPAGYLYVKADGDVIEKVPLFYDPPDKGRGFWQLFGVVVQMIAGYGRP